MIRVLSALGAILGKYESVRIVLLILNAIVISALALGAFKRNFGSCRFGCHNQNSIQKITPLDRRVKLVYHTFKRLSIFFAPFSNFFYIFTKGIFREIFSRKTHPFFLYYIYGTHTRTRRGNARAHYAHKPAHTRTYTSAVKSARILLQAP